MEAPGRHIVITNQNEIVGQQTKCTQSKGSGRCVSQSQGETVSQKARQVGGQEGHPLSEASSGRLGADAARSQCLAQARVPTKAGPAQSLKIRLQSKSVWVCGKENNGAATDSKF